MNTDSTAYSNIAFEAFLAIDASEYKEKVRFVDINKAELSSLPHEQYLQVMDAYAEALFEMGRYNEHIAIADHLIEQSILQNIQYVGRKDLYRDTLFHKAASLYNLEDVDGAIYILQELLKMESEDETTRLFLINCYVRKRVDTLRLTRKVSIIAILSSALIIMFELLLIRPIFPGWVETVEFTRNALFGSGTAVLVLGELYVRYRAVSEMYSFVSRL